MNKKDYSFILKKLRQNLKDYVQQSKLQSLVLGISGGIDSALMAAIAKPVCDELDIPLIGAFIEIESNKIDEKKRAMDVGIDLCDIFIVEDLTEQYLLEKKVMENPFPIGVDNLNNLRNKTSKLLTIDETDHEKKVRLGNIKARQRMIYLRNLAQRYKGATLDTDNKTEHMLGFWTISGDDFDLCLLLGLWKTEIYELAKYVFSTEPNASSLLNCITAIPTDGLGITSSDVEQFGCDTYDEVDAILIPLCNLEEEFGETINIRAASVTWNSLVDKYGYFKVNKIWDKHLNTKFKRCLPIDLSKF